MQATRAPAARSSPSRGRRHRRWRDQHWRPHWPRLRRCEHRHQHRHYHRRVHRCRRCHDTAFAQADDSQ
eukprot:9367822-Pyramimonas_sp.AAC.1